MSDLRGIIPPATTPFTADGEIDYAADLMQMVAPEDMIFTAIDALLYPSFVLRPRGAIAGDNLPACTKYAQTLQGCPGGFPRAPMPAASPAQQAVIGEALLGLGAKLVARAA